MLSWVSSTTFALPVAYCGAFNSRLAVGGTMVPAKPPAQMNCCKLPVTTIGSG